MMRIFKGIRKSERNVSVTEGSRSRGQHILNLFPYPVRAHILAQGEQSFWLNVNPFRGFP